MHFWLFLKSSKTFGVSLKRDTLTSKILNQELKAQWMLLQFKFYGSTSAMKEPLIERSLTNNGRGIIF